MVAASRIVCALAALCGAARAAPMTVTYDHRQHGEFNLQVEADGVAVVLLPGGSAADMFLDRKHYGVTGEKLQQIFGRRHGVEVSRKKKKPVAQNCTSTATQPEKPYTDLPVHPTAAAIGSTSTTRLPVESPEQYASESPAPYVSESPFQQTPKENAAAVVTPEDLDVRLGTDHRHYIRPGTAVEDPYSVTPDTPDIFPRTETHGDGDGDHVDVDDDDDAAVATVTELPSETTALVARDAAAAAPETKPSPEAVQTGGFEEKPASAPSSDVKTVDKPAVGADDDVAEDAAKAHAKPAADADAKTVDKPAVGAEDDDEVEDAAKVHAKPAAADVKPQTEDKPAAAVAAKTESSTDKTSAEAAKKPAVEMVAMKTMEKPTVSEPLKVVQAKIKQPSPSAETPAEMIAMKTIEKPSSATADKSGIAAKPVVEAPAQGDAAKSGDGPPAESVVSVSKPIEMVAVKTVDSPGAMTTVKSVVSVRTVIRPAGSPKTAAAAVAMSSNGTSIMRKVGDRKPLPSVTLEVSHPKVVV